MQVRHQTALRAFGWASCVLRYPQKEDPRAPVKGSRKPGEGRTREVSWDELALALTRQQAFAGILEHCHARSGVGFQVHSVRKPAWRPACGARGPRGCIVHYLSSPKMFSP